MNTGDENPICHEHIMIILLEAKHFIEPFNLSGLQASR